MKKPKISKFDFHIKVCDAPDNLVHIIHRDNLWMICMYVLYVFIFFIVVGKSIYINISVI